MSKFSFAKKFNTGKLFNIVTDNFEYLSLEDLKDLESMRDPEEKDLPHVVKGIYINTKGLYETQPVLALDGTYVNLPSHLTSVCKEMIADPIAVKAINEGHLGFRIESYYKEKYEKMCYSVEWVDL